MAQHSINIKLIDGIIIIMVIAAPPAPRHRHHHHDHDHISCSIDLIIFIRMTITTYLSHILGLPIQAGSPPYMLSGCTCQFLTDLGSRHCSPYHISLMNNLVCISHLLGCILQQSILYNLTGTLYHNSSFYNLLCMFHPDYSHCLNSYHIYCCIFFHIILSLYILYYNSLNPAYTVHLCSFLGTYWYIAFHKTRLYKSDSLHSPCHNCLYID